MHAAADGGGSAAVGEILRYGVVSDTHGLVPAPLFDIFDGVERIYHCGDVGSLECIEDLEEIAPVRLVTGNMDHASVARKYPDQILEEMEFGMLAMAHGSHYRHTNQAIIQGLLAQFSSANPRVVLFGHSHVPCLETRGNGILFVNPGSASRPRYGGTAMVALVEFDPATKELTVRHVAVK
jgi:hypothetical protein